MIDFNEAFPNPDSGRFAEMAIENWRNLKHGTTSGENVYVSRIHYQILNPPPRHGRRLRKSTSFFVWFIWCLESPWKQGGNIDFSESKEDEIYRRYAALKSMYPEDLPDYPDSRTLRNHIKQGMSILWKIRMSIVYELAQRYTSTFTPPCPDITHFVASVSDSMGKFLKSPDFRLKMKLAQILIEEKMIIKRDLQWRLRINKDHLEELLNWHLVINSIERRPRQARNSELIIFKSGKAK